MNRSTLVVVGGLVIVVSAVILAGAYFGGTPADSSQIVPAPVKVVNNGTKTVTFNISVVPVGDNLTTYRADGDTPTMPVTPGSFTLITNAENPTLKIEYPASARHHGTYTLDPGEEQLVNVSPVSSEEAIVVTVYEEADEHY